MKQLLNIWKWPSNNRRKNRKSGWLYFTDPDRSTRTPWRTLPLTPLPWILPLTPLCCSVKFYGDAISTNKPETIFPL
jgi:hypothetical protein